MLFIGGCKKSKILLQNELPKRTLHICLTVAGVECDQCAETVCSLARSLGGVTNVVYVKDITHDELGTLYIETVAPINRNEIAQLLEKEGFELITEKMVAV